MATGSSLFPTTACVRSCAGTYASRRKPRASSRMRRLVPLLALVALAPLATSCNWIREGRWQVYQDNGTRSLEKRQYGDAERQWKKALDIAEGFGAQEIGRAS